MATHKLEEFIDVSKEMRQCLTWGQMASADLPLHTRRHTHMK